MKIRELTRAASRGVHNFLVDLEMFVSMDSGTHDRELLQRASGFAASCFQRAGSSIEWIESPDPMLADTFVARVRGTGKRKILLLGHIDTVWAAGTAAMRPYREEGTIATGPGICDMKSGVLIGAYALNLLRDLDVADYREVTFIGNPDEEIGSPASREIIEREALDADFVLVLEPGRSPGSIQTTRKGVGMFEMDVAGVSSHAGANPEAGRSAVLELAHKTIALHGLTDFESGTTVNVGVLEGGSRRNVVPDHAVALIDLRVVTSAEARRATSAIQEIASSIFVEGTTTVLSGGLNRPPMEKNVGTERVLEVGEQIVSLLGLEFDEVSSGGGSDGNFTAALGVPTLDGLGAVGGGAHAKDEHIVISSIADRITLVAGLIAFGPARAE